jgi:hypothetical protein
MTKRNVCVFCGCQMIPTVLWCCDGSGKQVYWMCCCEPPKEPKKTKGKKP